MELIPAKGKDKIIIRENYNSATSSTNLNYLSADNVRIKRCIIVIIKFYLNMNTTLKIKK